ncbi:MAG: PIN domain-containing protein [Candidatus Hydrothermarchaeaceae archaeon]
MNVFEVLLGVFTIDSKRGEKMRDKVVRAFNMLEVLSFDYRDAVTAAEIGGKLAKQNKRVGADAITAAIAINNGCEAVVTRNEKHFRWIEEVAGLKVEAYAI